MFKLVLVSCLVGRALTAPPKHHRIVNGEDIDITSVPYQVAVGNSKSIWCGGSIIAQRFVLTAAHCFNDHDLETEAFMIFVGMTRKDAISYDMLRAVKTVSVHPDYDRPTHNSDIAVLELVEDLVYNEKIQAVSLPTPGATIPTGDKGYISGWGVLYDDGPFPVQLQGASVDLYEASSCSKYSNFDAVNMLCAGSLDGSVDSCQGDSGGPLVSNGILYGVTSFGRGCATPSFPGVYANVATFRDYINKITGF